MRIGVLADTHDRLPEAVADSLVELDEIWHLGDVCLPPIIAPLFAKPLFVVRGNCDDSTEWPPTLDLEREGLRFHLVHVPPTELPPKTDVVLHGHTHVPRDEIIRGVRFLNPGAVSRANRGAPPSYAILEVNEGAITAWRWVWFTP